MTLEMFMEPYDFDEWTDKTELAETEVEVIKDYVDTIGGFEKTSEKDVEKIESLGFDVYAFAN